jgi:hypothetical protein
LPFAVDVLPKVTPSCFASTVVPPKLIVAAARGQEITYLAEDRLTLESMRARVTGVCGILVVLRLRMLGLLGFPHLPGDIPPILIL